MRTALQRCSHDAGYVRDTEVTLLAASELRGGGPSLLLVAQVVGQDQEHSLFRKVSYIPLELSIKSSCTADPDTYALLHTWD